LFSGANSCLIFLCWFSFSLLFVLLILACHSCSDARLVVWCMCLLVFLVLMLSCFSCLMFACFSCLMLACFSCLMFACFSCAVFVMLALFLV
jgi:hypothetical protein